MIGCLTALVLLSAAPPVKLASPGLTYVNMDPKVGDLYADYFARQLEEAGVHVTTANEISAVLGLEKQKQLLGCNDESASACLAELGGALGVDGIITGSFGKVGTGYTVSLKVVDAKDGRSMGAFSARVKDEDALFDWMGSTAKKLARSLRPQSEAGPSTVVVTEKGESGSILPWVSGGVGVVALAAGGLFLLQANSIHQNLTEGPTDKYPDDASLNQAVQEGKFDQRVGWVGIGVGVVALSTSVVLFTTGAKDSPKVGAWLGRSSGMVVVGGQFE